MKRTVLTITALLCMTAFSAVAKNNSSCSARAEEVNAIQTGQASAQPAQVREQQLGHPKKMKDSDQRKQQSPKYDPLETTLELYN